MLADKPQVIIIRESKRTNAEYRASALACLGDYIQIRGERTWFAQVHEITKPLIEELLQMKDDMDVDSKSGGSSSKTLYVLSM